MSPLAAPSSQERSENQTMAEETKKVKYDRFILRQGEKENINVYGVKSSPEDVVEYLATWDRKAQIEISHFLSVVLYGVGKMNKDQLPPK